MTWHILALAGILAAALGLRLIGLDRESLWTDEAYSLWMAQQPYSAIWGEIARAEYNPVLYYILLKAWVALFGDSEAALRGLSALINTVSVVFVYLTVRWSGLREHGRSIALIAAALFALSFAELQYAQEARTYSLCVMAMSIMVAATARIVSDQLAPRGGQDRITTYWPFALLGAGAALAIWSHYTMALIILMVGALHLIFWATFGGRNLRQFAGYAVAAGVFFVLGGRAVWLMIAYAMPASGNFWIEAPTFADTLDAATLIFGGATSIGSWKFDILLRALLFGLWPVLGLYALWRSGRTDLRVFGGLLAVLSFGVFLAILAVSYAGKPIFLQRVLLPAQIAWVVLSAFSVLAFANLRQRQLAAGLVTACFAVTALTYTNGHPALAKEPWRAGAEAIASQARQGETVYTSATGALLMGYYLPRLGREDLQIEALNGDMETPPPHEPFSPMARDFTPKVTLATGEILREGLSDGAPAWVIIRAPDNRSWGGVRDVTAEFGAVGDYAQRLNPGPIALYRIPGEQQRELPRLLQLVPELAKATTGN